jgi:hypothetical protein
MDPLTIIAMTNAALGLVEALMPAVSALFKNGQISVEEQQKLLDRYNAIKATVDAGFEGPEWKQSTDKT